jgi:hypothetical protein
MNHNQLLLLIMDKKIILTLNIGKIGYITGGWGEKD